MEILRKFRHVLIALILCAIPAASFAQVFVGVLIRVAPPVLPVYVQPPCPTPGYLWTPGYWAYGPAGYYWVPGVWVAPPSVGLLWTPGYWAFSGGYYGWHPGYWGPHVGFYGGVNYGFGYTGVGFVGGVWAGSVFRYNTAVVNVNTTVIHDTYINRTVINNTVVNNRSSFNGPGGIAAQPSAQERMAMNEQHFEATSNQMSHQQMASQNRNQWASVNGGRPETVAMNRVNEAGLNQQAHVAGGANSEHFNAQNPGSQQPRSAPANGARPAPQEHGQFNHPQNHEVRQVHNEGHAHR